MMKTPQHFGTKGVFKLDDLPLLYIQIYLSDIQCCAEVFKFEI